MQVGIDVERKIVVMPADLENPASARRMLSEIFNRFELTFAGHTLEAYRRLPQGWRTTPADFPWTDLYMWRQFAGEAVVPRALRHDSDGHQHLDEFASSPQRHRARR